MSFLARSLNLLKLNGNVRSILRTLATRNLPVYDAATPTPTAPLAAIHAIRNQWIYKEQPEIENPIITNSIHFPNGLLWVPPEEDIESNIGKQAPPTENVIEKQAARLIVIRRKKMKKHKLRKLRKRMKFEWAKIRQRRELRKEKAFQAGLIAQCKEAESFNAEKYVEERLGKLHEMIIPKLWKGRRLPEFIIRQKMGLPPKS